MRITKQFAYDDEYVHLNHWGTCQRFYCARHRLLYRECLTMNDDCPKCNSEWEMMHELELWEKDQKRRQYDTAANS